MFPSEIQQPAQEKDPLEKYRTGGHLKGSKWFGYSLLAIGAVVVIARIVTLL